jgi:hypothetical protein
VRPQWQIKGCQTTEPRTFDSGFSGKVNLSTLSFMVHLRTYLLPIVYPITYYLGYPLYVRPSLTLMKRSHYLQRHLSSRSVQPSEVARIQAVVGGDHGDTAFQFGASISVELNDTRIIDFEVSAPPSSSSSHPPHARLHILPPPHFRQPPSPAVPPLPPPPPALG